MWGGRGESAGPDRDNASAYRRLTERTQAGNGGSALWLLEPETLIGKEPNVQVLVRDNNVDQALRALKKKLQREGVFREMKLRNFYEKPSEKRAREKAEAVRRARKLARKRAQREGVVPSKSRAR